MQLDVVLPHEISRLAALTSLWLSTEESPAEGSVCNIAAASGLRSLERLVLDEVGRVVLPQGGGAGGVLHVRAPGLAELPAAVSTLTGLQHLSFKGCTIREIPPWIGRLTRLACLTVGSSVGQIKVPLQLAELRGLKRLHLGGFGCGTQPLAVDVSDGATVRITRSAGAGSELVVQCPFRCTDALHALRLLVRLLEDTTGSAARCTCGL